MKKNIGDAPIGFMGREIELKTLAQTEVPVPLSSLSGLSLSFSLSHSLSLATHLHNRQLIAS